MMIIVACGVLFICDVHAQINHNVSLFGRLAPNPYRYSGSWFYVAPNGTEYGLVGGYDGTHVVAIDDSTNIHQVGFVAGPQSNWRELTVVGNHAFVVTEGGGTAAGMQVISLATLPDSVRLVSTYRSTFTTAHVIMRDVTVDSPYVYVSGASGTGGVHIINVANPASPVQVGVYDPTYYVHDAHVRGNRLYASCGSQGVDVVDISIKSNPVRLANIRYAPLSYTHSVWTSADNRFLFIADETDGIPAQIWNIENANAPFEVARYSANLQSLVHNPYIRGRYAFIAHNTEGMRVVDIADPTLPVEVGHYDTFNGPSGGFNGLWSACPYLPSGKILGGDRTGGLYIWRFNNTQAGRIYGTISDSLTGAPIDSARVTIIQTGRSSQSKANGAYRLGELPSGVAGYSLEVRATGYKAKVMNNVVVHDGDSLTLNIQLKSSSTSVVLDAQPTSFVLYQNYPNPFNPSTNIAFHVPPNVADTRLPQIEIFDLLGKSVATLLVERKTSGYHSVTWNAEGVSSGVYFYKLNAGLSSLTKKMVLIR
jgi:choice-of-anchor B domain-containing protein